MQPTHDRKTIRAFVMTDGRIVQSPVRKDSKQVPKDAESWYTRDKLVRPPYNPSQLLQMYDSNPVHAACCDQMAADIAGAGWTLDPVKVLGEKGEAKGSEKEREIIEKFLEKPGTKGRSLGEILVAGLTDYQSIGWRAFEVVRLQDKNGAGLEMYHVPAQTLRVHRDRWLYRQAWSEYPRKSRWFKFFGHKEFVDSETGEVREVVDEKQANELIVRHRYSSSSTYYGVPASIPALGEIIGMGEVRDYNIAFFRNKAMPEFMLTITLPENKGQLTDEEWKEIEQRLAECRSSGEQHKTAVLTVPHGSEVKVEKLGAEVKDSSFWRYEQTLVEKILMAHRMPPYRIGLQKVGQLGGTNIREATEIYKSGIVRPQQLLLESDINMVFREVLGVKTWRFRLKEIDTRDRAAEIERDKVLSECAGISPNELRRKWDIGKDYKGGDQYYIRGVPIEQAGMQMAKSTGSMTLLDFQRGLLQVIRNERKVRMGGED